MGEAPAIMERDQVALHFGMVREPCPEGEGAVSMVLDGRHLNAFGRVQGGAVFSLADVAFALASNARGPAVAASCSINFCASAKAGDRIIARAREASLSRKLGTYLVEVRDQDGRLIATFQGLAYRLDPPPPA